MLPNGGKKLKRENYVAKRILSSAVLISLEGAPKWLTSVAQIFPLTHLLNAVRKIMHDGAGLMGVSFEIVILSVMTLAFLTVGAALFSWNK